MTQQKRKTQHTSKDSKKPAAAKATGNRAASASNATVDEEQRRQLIAEVAYDLAEQRGFGGEGCVDDWLQAEKIVDRQSRKDADQAGRARK